MNNEMLFSWLMRIMKVALIAEKNYVTYCTCNAGFFCNVATLKSCIQIYESYRSSIIKLSLFIIHSISKVIQRNCNIHAHKLNILSILRANNQNIHFRYTHSFYIYIYISTEEQLLNISMSHKRTLNLQGK